MKVTILGCGLRTPLLLSALLEEEPAPEEISLFDLEHQRSELMASLGEAIHPGHGTTLRAPRRTEEAIEGADFVISSVRVGGMEQRAADERRAVELGYVGQETTGPAGFAMAVRTIPVAVGYARLMERLAPRAWMINLTNPASMITEAVLRHSKVRVVGVCDTPDELMHRLAIAFQAPRRDLRCEYFGLNHLGWVRKVEVAGVDRTAELLADEDKLNALYPAPLFSPERRPGTGQIPSHRR